jgi:ActR/RegA family two-component response regulator
MRNQCRGLFKQMLNTHEEAKTRDSTRRKRMKITKIRWRHIHHVLIVKK